MTPLEWRKSEGMTQEQVAEIVGCSKGMVSLLENGKRSPSLNLLNKYNAASEGKVTQNSFPTEGNA